MLRVWLYGLSNKPTRVSVSLLPSDKLLLGEFSGSLVTSAISAGVNPTVVRRSARVATFKSTIAELSITLTPIIVRTLRSLPTGAKNQKLSVKPSPSVSQNVRETMLRGVPLNCCVTTSKGPNTHSSLFDTPLAYGFSVLPIPIGSSSLMKFGSIVEAVAPCIVA